MFDIGKENPINKKKKALLIVVAAVLLVVAAFLLLRRSQPLGELIPAPETARVDGLFSISTIVPTPDGYSTFDTSSCRVEDDSAAAAALRSAMSEISVQRYYRLPTSLFSRFTQNENYVTVWWIPEDGQKHDLYLNWDEGFIYDDAHPAVAIRSTATRSRCSVSSAPSSVSTARTPGKIQQ